jgi:hypothetical protein
MSHIKPERPTRPSRIKDIKGKSFGRLKVVAFDGYMKHGNTHVAAWICKCDCGRERRLAVFKLTSGKFSSCGYCPITIDPDLPGEIWKTVSQDTNYEVSNLGRVRRMGKVLKPKLINTGYHMVHLSRNSKVVGTTVHRLVCTAFHGEPKHKRLTVNHKDGNKTNNFASNLEWATYSENNAHAFREGLKKPTKPMRGAAHPRSVLTEDDVKRIRASWRRGMGVDFAREYGVSPQAISNALRGKSWAHIT